MAAPTREEFIAYLAAAAAQETAEGAAEVTAAAAAAALATLETNVRSVTPPVFVIIADGDEGVDDGYYIAFVEDGEFVVQAAELLEAAE